jgi:hypothetical protein
MIEVGKEREKGGGEVEVITLSPTLTLIKLVRYTFAFYFLYYQINCTYFKGPIIIQTSLKSAHILKFFIYRLKFSVFPIFVFIIKILKKIKYDNEMIYIYVYNAT